LADDLLFIGEHVTGQQTGNARWLVDVAQEA
jgi:hypothetical protein